ncbi:MAG: UDP-N-acetylmuramate dehydrogenase [Bacteroidales bacterium]
MITQHANISLRDLNTFGIDAIANRMLSFSHEADLPELLRSMEHERNRLILGGGSNILFTGDYQGTILQPLLRGIEVVNESRDHVLVRVACSEPWDDFVAWTVEKGWGGVENLSLIPGMTGSSPIQNIGAYGVEVGEVVHSVEYIDLLSGRTHIIQGAECEFGYRTSIFKTRLKGQVLISHVLFLLSKDPVLRTHYGGLAGEMNNMGVQDIRAVRQAVCTIRRKKLPDPAVTGNAGSFFKNPVVQASLAHDILASFPDMPRYEAGENLIKIPAGWLIEKCGWKGFREGDAGVHPLQALVLVNYGSATGKEILSLAQRIRLSVNEKFKINLEMEVNVIE